MSDSSRSDRRIRRPAVIALGRVGDERAVDVLVEALNDGSNQVRRAAVIALEKMGASQAVKSLTKTMLQDKAPSVRKRAASAVRWIAGHDSDVNLGQ